MSKLGDEQKGILKALTEMTEPAGCKVIGEQAGIPWRTVMGKLRGLRKEGYVESPVKGKYVVTDKGREAVA
jgi:predicted transcriptional regulator